MIHRQPQIGLDLCASVKACTVPETTWNHCSMRHVMCRGVPGTALDRLQRCDGSSPARGCASHSRQRPWDFSRWGSAHQLPQQARVRTYVMLLDTWHRSLCSPLRGCRGVQVLAQECPAPIHLPLPGTSKTRRTGHRLHNWIGPGNGKPKFRPGMRLSFLSFWISVKPVMLVSCKSSEIA